MSYKVLEHTADLKIHVEGKSLADLFTEATLGMMDLMKPEDFEEKGKTEREISLKSLDETTLLIDFMSEVLFLAHTNKEIYTKIDFEKLSETKLKAKLHGVPISEFKEDIKAVTYHEVDVKQNEKGKWETNLVFDI